MKFGSIGPRPALVVAAAAAATWNAVIQIGLIHHDRDSRRCRRAIGSGTPRPWLRPRSHRSILSSRPRSRWTRYVHTDERRTKPPPRISTPYPWYISRVCSIYLPGPTGRPIEGAAVGEWSGVWRRRRVFYARRYGACWRTGRARMRPYRSGRVSENRRRWWPYKPLPSGIQSALLVSLCVMRCGHSGGMFTGGHQLYLMHRRQDRLTDVPSDGRWWTAAVEYSMGFAPRRLTWIAGRPRGDAIRRRSSIRPQRKSTDVRGTETFQPTDVWTVGNKFRGK